MSGSYTKLFFSKRLLTCVGVALSVFTVVGCFSQKPVADQQRQTPGGSQVSTPVTDHTDIPAIPREFRAVWVATVANIDWPSEPGLPVEKQKQELIDIMDRAAAMNMNAVIFQVRPAADALYASRYEPWSAYLTGQMGEAPVPFYDPLELAIEEAHKRGMELHAWFNPYRARHPSDSGKVASNHVSRERPELVLQFGDYQWLDPGLEEVRELSRNVILDVVQRYDVDGVHLDDYFYPYPSYGGGAEFPDSLSWQQALTENPAWKRADWRRHNVDRFIKQVYQDIKKEKPHVKFGISPFGTWRPGYPEGTGGFDAYSQLYADARLWLREGWVDYFTPQIYNKIDRVIRPFPVILQWWSEQNTYDRHLWPGLYTSRGAWPDWPEEEITGQVYIARGFPGVTGAIHFSMRSLMDWNSLVDDLNGGPYATPALVPASPWLGSSAPEQPSATLNIYPDKMMIEIDPEEEDQVRWWVVRSKVAGKWELDIVPGSQHTITFNGTEASVWPEKVAITAVDRLGNESPVTVLTPAEEQLQSGSIPKLAKPEIVARNKWGDTPRGYHANAARRNLSVGDTFKFRDLTVVLNEMIPGIDTTGLDSLASDTMDTTGEEEPIILPDTAHITLYRYGVAEDLKVPEGKAFNWHGYHIGLLAVNAEEGVLGSGLTEVEVGTVASLSLTRAAAVETGDASQRLRVPHKINRITLHHSGSAKPLTSDEDPVERLRNLYEWGMQARNWWDVPYHYLIGLDGTIYEGRDVRYAGETNTTYDTRGHLLITVMGNYNMQEPTQEQIKAVSDLMAWSAAEYDISPEHISGHFELADTGCPGQHLRKIFEQGTFHQAVKEQLLKLTARKQ